MSNDRINEISISINGKLSDLSHSSAEQCIFKVHARLRNHNKEAYEPQVLSIGPYHHGKPNLKEMETHKLRFLRELLHRMGEENADRYISALMELKDQARRCYAENINLSDNDFVEMLCLDGIFIIEFLRKKSFSHLLNRDSIFQMDWLFFDIMRDLILFENQIPFFILVKLFDMTKLPGQEDNLINLALPLWSAAFHIAPSGSHSSNSANQVVHLLDLLHQSCCSTFDAILEKISDPTNSDDFLHRRWCSSFEGILKKISWCCSFDAILKKITEVEINDTENVLSLGLKSASQLRQSGIKFERAQQSEPWLHITFENGKIKIPHLTVDDSTESIFRNLIAFEQYMTDRQSWRFVTDYAAFMDYLINSPKDVEKLCHYNILSNCLGDHEVVSTVFNKLVRDIAFSEKVCYWKVYKEVNKHSKKRWNNWKAHLMRNYFNTPWSIISFFAAVVLLILTAVQTIFAILQ